MLKKIQKHNSANSIDIYRRTNHLMLLSLLTYSHWPVLHPHIGSDWKMVGIQSLRVHQVTCKQQSFLLVSTCKRCLVVHKNNNQLMIKCIHISTYIQITILPFHTVHRVLKARIPMWFAILFSSASQVCFPRIFPRQRFFYSWVSPGAHMEERELEKKTVNHVIKPLPILDKQIQSCWEH